MGTFTFFSLGDHLFGDRFELLEHTLFWFVALASWVAFARLGSLSSPVGVVEFKDRAMAMGLAVVLIVVTSSSIVTYSHGFFFRRTAPLQAEMVGDHLYKVSFPSSVEAPCLRKRFGHSRPSIPTRSLTTSTRSPTTEVEKATP